MGWVGTMTSADGRWIVKVGGVGSVVWYRLEGPGVARNLPSMTALVGVLTDVELDVSDLHEA